MPLPDVTELYADDEDVLIRAPADYPFIAPVSQAMARGTDGVILSADRWTLVSASTDFGAQGVESGMVCVLTKPSPPISSSGECLVVDGVSGTSALLRRVDRSSRQGNPPAPAEGYPSANFRNVPVEFTVKTLRPQIIRACFDLNRRYGVDDLVAGRRESDLYDPVEVKEAAVLTVLYRQCLAMSQSHDDLYATKSAAYKQELDDLLARVVLHWRPVNDATGQGSARASTMFGMRLGR